MEQKQPGKGNRASKAAPAGGEGLNAELIVDAALSEIDLHGLDAFKIRSLTARLGVHPAAIYWHIGSKDLILSEVVARVIGQVLPLRAEGDWKERLRELFNRYRGAVRVHPNVAPLLGGTLIGNAKADLRLVETVLAAVVEAGLRGPAMTSGYNTVIAALVGFVSEEFATEPQQDLPQWREQIRHRLSQVRSEQFPVLAANLPHLMNRAFIIRWENGAHAPLDRTFEDFVEVILSGLEHMARVSVAG